MRDRYIYLIFTKTGTWLSKLIYIVSNIKYAHASISFDESFRQMYSFGRINPENPFSGGFVEESIYEGVYKKFTKCECMIYRVKVTAGQYCMLQGQISKFTNERNNLRYNFLGLFGILLNMPLGRENHYFCSQFVSEILIESNIFHCEKPPALIKTNELFSIKNKEIIYEGFLIEKHEKPFLNVFEI